MAQIVSNEIPSGTINGVNKVFTTTNTIQQVMTLMVDGAEYFNFTIGYNSNTITLTDAPTLSVYVDYIGGGYNTNPSLSLVTLQDIRNLCYDILREPQEPNGGTSAYPLSLMDTFINTAQQNILGGRVIHPITKEEVRKGEIHFSNAEAFYSNVPGTSLSQDAVIGDTILYADTTNYPTTGTLFILGNIIPYTGITATSFTGCSNIAFDHPGGSQISLLYSLPTDYSSVINVIYKNRIKLPQKLYDDIFEDLNSVKGSNLNKSRAIGYYDQPYRVAPFYTIKDATYLLIYNFNELDAMIKLRYEKLPTVMVNAGDTCSIDNDNYAKTTIPYMAVAEMLFSRGEETRASAILSFGMSKIREMYSWYDSTDYEKISGVHYKMGKGRLNI